MDAAYKIFFGELMKTRYNGYDNLYFENIRLTRKMYLLQRFERGEITIKEYLEELHRVQNF